MKKLVTASRSMSTVVAMGFLVAANVCADQTWIGAAGVTNDWNQASNWNGGAVPSNTLAWIVNGGVAEIGADAPNVSSINVGAVSGASPSGTVTHRAGRLTVSGGSYPVLVGFNSNSGQGLYDISGGTLTVTGGVFVGSSESHSQSYGTGLLAVRGSGVVEHTGNQFYVAHYGRTGAVVIADTGRLTLKTGALVLGEGGAVNIGTLTVSGGTFSARGLATAQTGGSASVGVSGGSLWLDWLTSGSGVADIRLSGGTLGAQNGNAVWSAPMTLTNGTVTFYTGDQSGTARVNTASGVLIGNGALVIANAPGQTAPGTLALGANNTYTGETTLQGDNTLQLGAGGAAGWLSGPLTIASNGSLAFGRSDVVTNSLSISGAGDALIQNGTGTLVLTNATPAFNTAVANAGVLRFASPAAIPGTGASVTINSGGAVAADGAYGTVTDWLNSGRIAASSTGALALTGDNSETIDMTAAGGGLYTSLSLGASGNITYTGLLTPLGGTYRLGGGGGTLTYASTLTSGNVVIGGGAGSVVLAANNTFAGGVTVNSGTLRVGDPNGLGSGRVTVGGGVLQVNTNLQASGGILVTNTGLVQVGPGGTIDGLISNNVLNAGAANTAGLVFNGSGIFTHASDVTGTGSLVAIGGGTLMLNTPGQTISQNWVFAGNNGSAGNIELSAGTLNVSDWLVVARGALMGTSLSMFTLSGGTVNKSGAGWTLIGDLNGSVGGMVLSNSAVYNAAGGNVAVSTGNGTGTLNVCGGTLNQTANDLVVANGNGSGTVNLYGGVVSNSAGNVLIGYGAGGSGTLTMTNGVLFSKNNLSLGQLAGASGTFNLTDGNVKAGTLLVGEAGTGRVTQTGGTISRLAGNEWRLGNAAGSAGTYNLQGGTLDTGTGNFYVGANGRGTLLQTGGILQTGVGFLVVGRFGGGMGDYTLAGGIFNQTDAGVGLIIGEQGTGFLTVTNSGVANLSGSWGLIVGHATGTGTVTLATGGLISTPICQKLAGTSRSTFNFDGGTLRTRANGATIGNFMQGLTEVYVRAGGAIIDSSNNTVTVAQNLMSGASPDGGLTKLGTGTLTLSGTNSYNGATTISNGTLRLGSANAITNTGEVRVVGGSYDLGGLTVTNGAVTLSAGSIINGALNADSCSGTDAGTLAVGLTGPGGLTKSGSGTLTLKTTQTYSGPTRVSGGVLKLTPASSDALIHYDFDTDTISGTTVVNLGTGGAAYNGVIIGALTTGTSGKLGQAVMIGNLQGVVTANAVTLTNAFSFATWVKSNGSSAQYQRIINNAYQTGGYLGTDSANKFLTIIKGKDFSSSSQSSADTAVWHHVALVWDGLNAILYYDGAPIQTKTYPSTDASLISKIGFGNNVVPNGEFWNGSMDEAYVFGRALSAGEVANLYGVVGSGNLLPATTSLQLENGAMLDLGGGDQTVAGLSGSGWVTNGTLLVNGVVSPGGIGSLNTLTIVGSPILTGTLRMDVATDGTSDLLKVQGALNLSGLTLQVENASALRASLGYTIATFTPGQLTGRFASDNLAGTGVGIVYDNVAGEIRLISAGTMVRFL